MMIKIVFLLGIILNSKAFSQDYLEKELYYPTSSLNPGVFVINPSDAANKGLLVEGGFFIRDGETDFQSKRNNNETKIKSDYDKSIMGIGLSYSIDPELELGLTFQRSLYEVKSKNDNLSDSVKEKHEGYLVNSRASLQLIPSLRIGVLLKLWSVDHSVLGNIRLDDNSNTNFDSTLLGSGAGVNYRYLDWKFGASYILPMKGKTEVNKEEIVLAEPGFADLNVILNKKTYVLGFSYLRFLYKNDERSAGSSLADNNNSEIDLFGLNADDNLLRPVKEYHLGGDYIIDEKSRARASLTRIESEFNFELDRVLPGADSSKERYKKFLLKLEYTRKLNLLNVVMGFSQQNTEYKFNENRTDFEYKSDYFSLYIMANKSL